MAKEKKRFLIIDGNSIIHRAYHALPPLTTKKGELVNALYGFLLVFFKAIKDFQPDYIAAAFDFPAPTFRHRKYKEYKAKRPPMPKELSFQIPKIKKILKAFTVPIFEKQGFEADDIIASLAQSLVEARKENKKFSFIKKIIISGDSDLLQLIDEKTQVYLLKKGIKETVLYDKNLVGKKFQGLSPEQILDLKALKGDASDNIPGVAGVGEKTALKLILEFGNLENIYKEIEKNSEKAESLKPKIKKTLLDQKKIAFLSKDLVKIDKNIPLEIDLEKFFWKNYDKEKVSHILKEFEFYSLLNHFSRIDEKKDKKEKKENLKLW